MTCRFVSGYRRGRGAVAVAAFASLGLLAGCGGGTFQFTGTPYPVAGGRAVTGPGNTGSGGGGVAGGSRAPRDACSETQARKFVRVSMRNFADDYIHYFFVAIAFIDVNGTGAGAVCPADTDLYTSFGYTEIAEGAQVEFGDLCIPGPALLYFHRGGQFRSAAGSGGAGLASAIAPAQGTSPTYDNFFNSGGAQMPVPDVILFHNPGTGEGSALKISRSVPSPCSDAQQNGDPICQQDAFYYVDETDRLTGSTALGEGSGRRVPSEIQATGCQCLGVNQPWFVLAPSGATASNGNCNEFFRGGRVEFAFIRDDRNPPIPQGLSRVTDGGGGVAHDFDSRAGVP